MNTETAGCVDTAREARERRERLAQRARDEAAESATLDHPLNCTCFACCALRDGYAAQALNPVPDGAP